MGNECGDADALILDNYIPADGDYIVVKKDGSVVKCSIKMDKKAGRPVKDLSDGDSQYEDIVFYDYHSRLVSMDKPQDPKKVIHSNNYLSFWIKKESLTNGKLNMEGTGILIYYPIQGLNIRMSRIPRCTIIFFQ